METLMLRLRFELLHQHANSPYCSPYISINADKENLSINQEFL